MNRTDDDGRGGWFDRRRRLVLFLGLALILVGATAEAELVAAVGTVLFLAPLLVWPYVRDAFDAVGRVARGVRRRAGAVGRLVSRDDDTAARDRDPVDRLQERYANDEITETEFEQRMETVLQTDDDEVAELIVEE